MDRPIVAVFMVTYNHEKFIEQSIESVLMQKTSFPIKIFIGEDCSTDNTGEICLRYQLENPGVVEVISNRRNLGAIINSRQIFGTCFSSGAKYIAMLEGDDFWVDPHKLQKQVDFLDLHTEFVLSFHNVIAVNVIDDKRTKSEIEREILMKSPEDIPIGHPSHTSSMLFRNVIKDYPEGFDNIISGDSLLQFILRRYGATTFQKNIYPNVRRRHPESIWSYKSNEYKLVQGICLYEKLLEIAINNKEVRYINKVLIKNRTRYIRYLWSNHRKLESINTLKKMIIEAITSRLFWFLVVYNITTIPFFSKLSKKTY